MFHRALALREADALQEVCEALTKLRKFGAYNAALVHVQRPGEVAVGYPQKWRALGRAIAADAIPIIVLRPFGPVALVYELGDTTGRAITDAALDSLTASGVMPAEQLHRTIDGAARNAIIVEFSNLLGAARSAQVTALSPSDKAPRWRIRVNSRLEPASQFAALSHELAHVYCGHWVRTPAVAGRTVDRFFHKVSANWKPRRRPISSA